MYFEKALYLAISFFPFGVAIDLQRSKNHTEDFHLFLFQLPLMLTSYIITVHGAKSRNHFCTILWTKLQFCMEFTSFSSNVLFFFFFAPDPIQDFTLYLVSFFHVSSDLWQSLSLPLSIMILSLLKNASQLFCSLSLYLGLPVDFSWICNHDTTKGMHPPFSVYRINRFIMSIILIADDANLDHWMKRVGFSAVKLLFSFFYLISWGKDLHYANNPFLLRLLPTNWSIHWWILTAIIISVVFNDDSVLPSFFLYMLIGIFL